MNKILNTYSNNILDIYINNFPDYLRTTDAKFKKNIHKYYYYDLWIQTNNHKININNIDNNEELFVSTKLIETNLITTPAGIVSLVGFAFLNFFTNHKLLHLDYISLNKQYQGNGSGTFYLNYIINTFYKTNNKIKFMILECEDHLIKFYEKNGFNRIKFNYNNYGIKLNLMLYNYYKYKYSEILTIANFLFSHFNILNNIVLFYLKLCQFINHSYLNVLILMLKLKYHIIDNYKK